MLESNNKVSVRKVITILIIVCAVMTGIIPARFELFESDEEKLFHLTTSEHCIIVVVIIIFVPAE